MPLLPPLLAGRFERTDSGGVIPNAQNINEDNNIKCGNCPLTVIMKTREPSEKTYLEASVCLNLQTIIRCFFGDSLGIGA